METGDVSVLHDGGEHAADHRKVDRGPTFLAYLETAPFAFFWPQARPEHDRTYLRGYWGRQEELAPEDAVSEGRVADGLKGVQLERWRRWSWGHCTEKRCQRPVRGKGAIGHIAGCQGGLRVLPIRPGELHVEPEAAKPLKPVAPRVVGEGL